MAVSRLMREAFNGIVEVRPRRITVAAHNQALLNRFANTTSPLRRNIHREIQVGL